MQVVNAGVHASADGAEVATPVSLVEWFLNFYTAAQEGDVKPVEGVVRAGEVLFVPRGWWHLAMNLEVMLKLFVALTSIMSGTCWQVPGALKVLPSPSPVCPDSRGLCCSAWHIFKHHLRCMSQLVDSTSRDRPCKP